MSTNLVDKNRRFHSLEEIFADDDLDLIGEVRVRDPSLSIEDRLQEKARELLDFVKSSRRLPAENDSLNEKRLFRRLQSLQESDPELAAALEQMAGVSRSQEPVSDKQTETAPSPDSAATAETKATAKKVYQSLDEIFNEDDDLDLLGSTDVLQPQSSTGRPDKKPNKPKMPDVIAKAKPCRDFFNYEPLFDEVRAGLATKDLVLQRRHGYYVNKLEAGQIFVLNGVYVLLRYCNRENIEVKNHRKNFRIDLIYSSGNENSPIAYTFLKSLDKDENGMQVSAVNTRGTALLDKIKTRVQELREGKEPKDAGQQTVSGYIYILRTKSKNPTILEFLQHSHLVKIGYCTTPVEERIKNAANEATYLYAPVDLVKSWRCYGNIDAHKFEELIHGVLYRHRFNPIIRDAKGRRHEPREWFTVSAETACEVVERIIDRSISQYRLNPLTGTLVRKEG